MLITIVTLVLAAAGFVWGKIRADIVALIALLVLTLSGILTTHGRTRLGIFLQKIYVINYIPRAVYLFFSKQISVIPFFQLSIMILTARIPQKFHNLMLQKSEAPLIALP